MKPLVNTRLSATPRRRGTLKIAIAPIPEIRGTATMLRHSFTADTSAARGPSLDAR